MAVPFWACLWRLFLPVVLAAVLTIARAEGEWESAVYGLLAVVAGVLWCFYKGETRWQTKI